MRYERLHINHFGKFQNVSMTFPEGISLIHVPDSSAGDAFHAFLESVRYGIDRGTDPEANALYSRYFPDSGSSTYSGVLEFTAGGCTWSIYRNFFRDPRGCTLMNETHNRSYSLSEDDFIRLMDGLSRSLYRDTTDCHTSDGQDPGDADRICRYMDNLCSSGSASLDLQRAQARLLQDRTALEGRISADTENRAGELRSQISRLQEERDRLPDASELAVWEKQLQSLQDEITGMETSFGSLREEIAGEEKDLNIYDSLSGAALQEAEDRCQRLLDRRERLLEQYPEPAQNPLRQAYPVLIGGSAILGLAGLILAVLSFLRGSVLPGVGGLLAAGAGVLLVIHFLRSMQALSAFRYVDRSLRRLYAEVLPQMPEQIDQQSLGDFLELMEELKRRRAKLQHDHRQAESLSNRIRTLSENRKRIIARSESKKEEFRGKIQLQEKITLLQDELESLQQRLEENRRLREEIAAADLAMDTIRELSVNAFAAHASYIQSSASDLLSRLTGGRYTGLRLVKSPETDKDTASAQLLVNVSAADPASVQSTMNESAVEVPVGSLSRDDRVPVLLALRLAAVSALRSTDPIPLVLDDGFLPEDPSAFTELISRLSAIYPGQILIVTSGDRPEELPDGTSLNPQVLTI